MCNLTVKNQGFAMATSDSVTGGDLYYGICGMAYSSRAKDNYPGFMDN